jgi:hypothetical protein
MIKTKIEELEYYIANNPESDTIDLILEFVELHNIDVAQAANYINKRPSLLAKVESEAINNRALKITKKALPI